MTITERMGEIVDHLNALESMSDEDFIINNYWTNNVVGGTGGTWLSEFIVESEIVSPDRLTTIAILKNVRQIQCVFAFTETGTDI